MLDGAGRRRLPRRRRLPPRRADLVVAQVDAATGKLYSKVRTSFRTQPGPNSCPGDDPIITRLSDGTPVDTGLLSGMKGKWRKVIVAFLGAQRGGHRRVVVLVSLKHLVTRVLRTGRSSWYPATRPRRAARSGRRRWPAVPSSGFGRSVGAGHARVVDGGGGSAVDRSGPHQRLGLRHLVGAELGHGLVPGPPGV